MPEPKQEIPAVEQAFDIAAAINEAVETATAELKELVKSQQERIEALEEQVSNLDRPSVQSSNATPATPKKPIPAQSSSTEVTWKEGKKTFKRKVTFKQNWVLQNNIRNPLNPNSFVSVDAALADKDIMLWFAKNGKGSLYVKVEEL